MMNRKEIAKFLSGFVAHEALTHTLLSGSGLLPLTMFGITLTPEYNTFVVIFWWIATFGLIYFAWLKK